VGGTRQSLMERPPLSTQDAPLPAELWDWITARVGDLSAVTDMSWSRSGPVVRSRVWRVAAGQHVAYVKVSANAGD
jgi:hypothetical protein